MNKKNIEYYIIFALYILLLILVIVKIYNYQNNFENFTLSKCRNNNNNLTTSVATTSVITSSATLNNNNNNNGLGNKIDINSYKMISILPSLTPDSKIYFGVIVQKKEEKIDNDNFVISSADIKNKFWKKNIKNGKLDDKSIIIDLFYDKNKKLGCIGMKMVNSEPLYTFYLKETDYSSKWVKIKADTKIKSLLYDIETESLLGLHNFDSQIYNCKKDFEYLDTGDENDWHGPINYSLPMRKIMYDKEGFMIGIDLQNNYLYRKKHIDWKQSDWDMKNINKTKIYDAVYDEDGCLIACTSNGLQKQVSPDFNSEFIPLKDYNMNTNEIIYNIKDIIKFKLGIVFDDDIFDESTELGSQLKKLYNFKKISKQICSNRKYLVNKTNKRNFDLNIKDENVDQYDINKQNREINELYNSIDEYTKKLKINY